MNPKTYFKSLLTAVLLCGGALCVVPSLARERVSIDRDWSFSFGHTDPALDFGCGTEYFNYLTKVNSIHNAGPYARSFNDSAWVRVDLPFDFVTDLPYDSLASHSHGYKTVGYRYPATSVGWYRHRFTAEKADSGMRHFLVFDGIFRDSRVWINGFYLGGEPSGYTRQIYDITPYLTFGPDADNIIAVRADATLEEGWFYEGGGIYRHVWLEKAPAIYNDPSRLRVWLADSVAGTPTIAVAGRVENRSASLRDQGITVKVELLEPDGTPVKGGLTSTAISLPGELQAAGGEDWKVTLRPSDLRLWSPDEPNIYKVRVSLEGTEPDTLTVKTGFRTLKFDPDEGLFINGRHYKMLGVNQHQDHPGLGAGIPDAVNVYRLKELMKYGVNTVRTSHNPFTPEALDACDSLGILVVEENRLLGINDYHVGQLSKMIDRDFNHPSVIMWSVGNEEWGVEWDQRGATIVGELRPICHQLDPTRPMAVATSSGPKPVETPDIAGYNYIMQNPVEKHRAAYPERIAFGSEETSGCGTRGVYFADQLDKGRMPALNREPDTANDSTLNRIGRGWKFYRDRPWLLGLCYWTGFDYRGEPNPMKFPATGSQFGLLDYCGFPKDEAFYLKAQWTDEPVLHILPHWNLEGHEGEEVDVWVYTNADEVELRANGRSLGRQIVEPGGYASFRTVYKPGRLEAKGYRNGKRMATTMVETAGEASKVMLDVAHEQDGIRVINVSLADSKGRFTPTACPMLTIELPEGARLLGAGNGDPAIQAQERPTPGTQPREFSFPAYNGHAQFIVEGGSAMPVIKL